MPAYEEFKLNSGTGATTSQGRTDSRTLAEAKEERYDIIETCEKEYVEGTLKITTRMQEHASKGRLGTSRAAAINTAVSAIGVLTDGYMDDASSADTKDDVDAVNPDYTSVTFTRS